MTRKQQYVASDLAQEILNAIDDGARDVFDINSHVVAYRQAHGVDLHELTDFTREIRNLRFEGRLIEPARSPRHPHRSAYQRTITA